MAKTTRNAKNKKTIIELEKKQLMKEIESESCGIKLQARITVWLNSEYGEDNPVNAIYYRAIFKILENRFSPLTFERLQEAFEEFEAIKYFFRNKQLL